jgi:hypothetical protein
MLVTLSPAAPAHVEQGGSRPKRWERTPEQPFSFCASSKLGRDSEGHARFFSFKGYTQILLESIESRFSFRITSSRPFLFER